MYSVFRIYLWKCAAYCHYHCIFVPHRIFAILFCSPSRVSTSPLGQPTVRAFYCIRHSPFATRRFVTVQPLRFRAMYCWSRAGIKGRAWGPKLQGERVKCRSSVYLGKIAARSQSVKVPPASYVWPGLGTNILIQGRILTGRPRMKRQSVQSCAGNTTLSPLPCQHCFDSSAIPLVRSRRRCGEQAAALKMGLASSRALCPRTMPAVPSETGAPPCLLATVFRTHYHANY